VREFFILNRSCAHPFFLILFSQAYIIVFILSFFSLFITERIMTHSSTHSVQHPMQRTIHAATALVHSVFSVLSVVGICAVAFAAAFAVTLTTTFATSGSAYAQGGAGGNSGTITGKVFDAKTKDPLSARVFVASIKRGAAAKADGTFSFVVPAGTYEVQASFTSYKATKQVVTVAAGGTSEVNFGMNEDLVRTAEAVVLGTRRADRTVVESPVPVDIVPAAEMRQSGMVETNQMIQMVVPSFNFPRPAIADGTDALRPATIRGLGPDQTLVLVNGKRRHGTALVHVNGTVGRGSTGVDMNAIPANMIERIEVLRDGAAAQYGSDAIAGVLNVILRKDAGLNVSSTIGRNTRGDGTVAQASANYGLPLPNGGYLHFGGEYRFRDSTNRTGVDLRRQAPGAGAPGDVATGDWAFDDPRRINHWQGDSRTRDFGGFLNGLMPVSETMSIYLFGGYTYRESESYGFFRLPRGAGNIPSVYPNGFLPQIFSRLTDFSIGGGVKGDLDGWNYDLSAVTGSNSFNFNVRNSLNASLGPSSPTQFNCGTLGYNQTSINLDVSRSLDIGLAKSLNLAFGAEYRIEGYSIVAGEDASWFNQPGNIGATAVTAGPGASRDTTISGQTVRIPASTAPVRFTPTVFRVPTGQDGAGGIPAAGAQVFPGFRPSDAKNVSRSNLSLYLDAETNPSENWNVGAAVRFENYSDFGSLVTGKFATRYEFIPGFAIRAAAASGFRAPSLQQQFFTATSTNFINGIPFDISTVPATSDAGKAFGAVALKPETSINLSAGFTFDAIENLSLSVDYYNIAVKDRITLSGNFVGGAATDSVPTLLARAGLVGVGGGRFFTNILDTRTQGLDVTARYGFNLGDAGTLRLTVAANFNENKIERLGDAPAPLKRLEGVTGGIPATGNLNALFDRGERVRFELGQPRTNLNIMVNYNVGKFAAMVRTVRFGEVTVVNQIAVPELDQVTSGLFVTDLDLSYEVLQGLRVAVGANNLFDTMPQEWTRWLGGNIPAAAIAAGQYQNSVPLPSGVPATQGVATNGTVFRYPALGAPWGMSGRYLYARVSFALVP
jgi:iron complex outermembrane recepter protein